MKKNVLTKLNRYYVLVLTAILPLGCTIQDTKEVDLNKDKDLREIVYNQIINNQELFNEFMLDAMENQNAMHWMMDNETFMHDMFSSENFDYMMKHRSGMANYMMEEFYDNISNDSLLLSHWQNMVENSDMHHGMMYN